MPPSRRRRLQLAWMSPLPSATPCECHRQPGRAVPRTPSLSTTATSCLSTPRIICAAGQSAPADVLALGRLWHFVRSDADEITTEVLQYRLSHISFAGGRYDTAEMIKRHKGKPPLTYRSFENLMKVVCWLSGALVHTWIPISTCCEDGTLPIHWDHHRQCRRGCQGWFPTVLTVGQGHRTSRHMAEKAADTPRTRRDR